MKKTFVETVNVVTEKPSKNYSSEGSLTTTDDDEDAKIIKTREIENNEFNELRKSKLRFGIRLKERSEENDIVLNEESNKTKTVALNFFKKSVLNKNSK